MSERVLHEWSFAGYVCRIVETEPGIVHFEQAQGPPIGHEQIGPLAFNRTEKPLGCANEIIHLSQALAEANVINRDLSKAIQGWQEDRNRRESELAHLTARVAELEEAAARGPHYLRDSRLRADGMRFAAEIARNLRPQDACTCGNYLSFRNGVPGHLPGCLVGECIEVADEIEGRAEEIDRSNRE